MKKITKKQIQEQKRSEDIETLKNMLEKSNKKVYQTVLHVSQSGMSRIIKNNIIVDDNLVNIDYLVSSICNDPIKKGGIFMKECGMDMTFTIRYNLGMAIYKDGYVLLAG